MRWVVFITWVFYQKHNLQSDSATHSLSSQVVNEPQTLHKQAYIALVCSRHHQHWSHIEKYVCGKWERKLMIEGRRKSIEEEFTMTLHVIHNEMWHFLLYDFSPHTILAWVWNLDDENTFIYLRSSTTSFSIQFHSDIINSTTALQACIMRWFEC